MKDVDDDDAAVDVEENSHEWATKSETQTNQWERCRGVVDQLWCTTVTCDMESDLTLLLTLTDTNITPS